MWNLLTFNFYVGSKQNSACNTHKFGGKVPFLWRRQKGWICVWFWGKRRMNSGWFYRWSRFIVEIKYYIQINMWFKWLKPEITKNCYWNCLFWTVLGPILKKCSTRKLYLSVRAFRSYKMHQNRTSYEETESRLLKVDGFTVKFFT